MILLNENKPHLITLSTTSKNKTIERFPNQLIWDINTFLLESLHLYEFYFSSKKETESAIKISKSIFGRNEFLCFESLKPMYKRKDSFNEEELWSEYVKHKNEVSDFNVFTEIYLMETINELNYVAVDSFEHFFENISEERQKNLSNEKRLKSLMCQLCPVCVFIGDHDWMEIHIRELSIQKSLIAIISKYIAK